MSNSRAKGLTQGWTITFNWRKYDTLLKGPLATDPTKKFCVPKNLKFLPYDNLLCTIIKVHQYLLCHHYEVLSSVSFVGPDSTTCHYYTHSGNTLRRRFSNCAPGRPGILQIIFSYNLCVLFFQRLLSCYDKRLLIYVRITNKMHTFSH